jgi:transcriptional regulator with XRE-family HTH domain
MVETIRDLCKKKKIAISRLEKDLNYGNGYLNPKKATTVDSKRLKEIADYLDVPLEMLYGEEKEHPATVTGSGMNPDYDDLTAENRALVDDLIAKLLKSQSAD